MEVFMEELQPRNMIFLFCRIHFVDLFGIESKKNFYSNLIKMQNQKENVRKFYWAFGDVGKVDIDNHELVYGRLGKTAKERFETVYNEEKHSYSKELIKINSSNYSNFFILPEYNAIAFEEKYTISRNQFIKNFQKMWIETTSSEIAFEYLLDEIEAYDLIKSWDKIYSATFKLVPTNPSSREDFAPLDKFIQVTRATRAKFVFENKENGLNFEDSAVSQGVSMSSAGYGDFDVKGKKGNSGAHVTSKGLQIKRDLVQIDDLSVMSVPMMKEILNIVKVMNKNGKK